MVAITKHHKVGGGRGCFNNRNILSPNPEAGVDQGVCKVGYFQGLGGTICPLPLPSLLVIFW